MKEAYLISEVVLIKFAQILEVSRGVTTGRFPVPAVTALLLRDRRCSTELLLCYQESP